MHPIATIDLSAIAFNYRALQTLCGAAEVAATVKADAYGLGVKAVAQTVYDAGCRSFYVAHYSEALELRTLLNDVTLFVLHGIPAGAEQEASEKNIMGVVTDLGALERLQTQAKKTGKKTNANLHLDTGMNRIGFCAKEWTRLKNTPDLLDGITVTHVISHFACSDEPDHPMNNQQQAQFINETKHFTSAKKSPIKFSLANSYGIFLGKQMHFDQVRPGRALSGIGHGLKNALSLHAPIIQLRLIDSAGTVGYGASQQVKVGMRLAALAIGYADGLARAFSNNDQMHAHHFYFNGTPVPVIGRVSMDLIMVDVSSIPVDTIHVGDMVEIAGRNQSIDDTAAQIDTIGYELMTRMGNRIGRRYITSSEN